LSRHHYLLWGRDQHRGERPHTHFAQSTSRETNTVPPPRLYSEPTFRQATC
jgi:hypothetical protein